MRMILALAATAMLLTASHAQQQPANPNANTPAVNTPNSPPNPGAPAAGANSFTESQAKSRIETNGFANVSGLAKDSAGRVARQSHEGRPVSRCERRLSRQRHASLNNSQQ